eukprot:1180915-Prorocentrum_minimum.AAC.6
MKAYIRILRLQKYGLPPTPCLLKRRYTLPACLPLEPRLPNLGVGRGCKRDVKPGWEGVGEGCTNVAKGANKRARGRWGSERPQVPVEMWRGADGAQRGV